MDVKKLLASHKEIDDRINLYLEEIAQLRTLAEKCTLRISGEPFSGAKGLHSDKVGQNAAKIADLEIRIDAEIDKLVDLKEQIMDMVSQLKDPTERAVIERRYILHETTETVADKTGYTPRHIRRVLNSALQHLEELYGDPVCA